MIYWSIKNKLIIMFLVYSPYFFFIYHIFMSYSLYQALHHRQFMLESDRKYASKLAGFIETFVQNSHYAVQRFQNR